MQPYRKKLPQHHCNSQAEHPESKAAAAAAGTSTCVKGGTTGAEVLVCQSIMLLIRSFRSACMHHMLF
jgi:hypothetical protein